VANGAWELPSDSELDDMSMKVAGTKFAEQPVPHRATIMQLTLLASIAVDTRDISDSIKPIEKWFEKSRLWEGEVLMR
jgi:hypothetical protein